MECNHSKTSKIFKAFCDPNRIAILEIISENEICGCVLLDKLSITQSTLSHHMKILVESGIVISRCDGKWRHYSINKIGIKTAIKFLENILGVKLC